MFLRYVFLGGQKGVSAGGVDALKIARKADGTDAIF